METAATTLPSGIALEDLLDWRPDFGVITVFVAIDPADRSKGWLIELRKVLTSAVESRDDAHDRGRALEATAQRALDRFDEEELPSGRCQIGFCEVAEKRARDIWTAAQMDGFRTSATYGDRSRLTQLLKLLDEGAAIGALAISAERGLLRRLEGGCQVPIAAHAEASGSGGKSALRLHGRVISTGGDAMVEGHEIGRAADEAEAAALGCVLAERLLTDGAGMILAGARAAGAPGVSEP